MKGRYLKGSVEVVGWEVIDLTDGRSESVTYKLRLPCGHTVKRRGKRGQPIRQVRRCERCKDGKG